MPASRSARWTVVILKDLPGCEGFVSCNGECWHCVRDVRTSNSLPYFNQLPYRKLAAFDPSDYGPFTLVFNSLDYDVREVLCRRERYAVAFAAFDHESSTILEVDVCFEGFEVVC